MRLRVANRQFEPSLWASLATAAALAVCVALGAWQVGRAREKQALIDAFDRGSQTSVRLEAGLALDRFPRYQHVTAAGQYDSRRQILIDNMPSPAGGMPGYRVLTPFVRGNDRSRLLLVDRGWLPLGASRQTLPDVTVASESRTVSGRLDRLPAPGVRIGTAAGARDRAWPRVLFFPTVADLERALGQPVEPWVVLLDRTAPDGFVRAWKPAVGLGPGRHYGYAFQWFVLGLAAVVGFVVLSLRPDRSIDTNSTRRERGEA